MNDKYTIYVNGQYWQCTWQYGSQFGVGEFTAINYWNGDKWYPNLGKEIIFKCSVTDYNAQEGWSMLDPQRESVHELAMSR